MTVHRETTVLAVTRILQALPHALQDITVLLEVTWKFNVSLDITNQQEEKPHVFHVLLDHIAQLLD